METGDTVKKKGLKPWQGHKFGAEKIKDLLKWSKELNIKELTLYTFSIENFNRSKKEIEILFKLFKQYFKKLTDDKLNEIKIRFIGRIHLFPKELHKEMLNLMEKTKNNKPYKLNFALAYGGRAEIVDAVKKILAKKPNKINEDTITKNLYLQNQPDLVIRPGGEKRISNFLIWQSYYSEWHFTDKLWPEFTKQDLKKAVDDLKKRERRFGR